MEKGSRAAWWRKLSAGLAVLLCVEALFFWRISEAEPRLPEQEYEMVVAQAAQVETELSRIGLQREENQYPVEAMSALLTFKPQNVGFVRVSIGEHGNGVYVQMVLRSDDQQAIRNYVESLSGNDFFRNICITSLRQDGQAVTAEVVARREADK